MPSLSSASPTHQSRLTLADEAATQRFGAALARAIEHERAAIERAGLVIALAGDLGTGKTTLVRALLRAAGVTGAIKSPTFAVLEPYVVSSLDFYHFDFYRFSGATEFTDIGFRDLFGPGRICAIEWPERVGHRLPTPDLTLALHMAGDGRELIASASTELGIACLNRISNEMPQTAIGAN
jgi:tRNA threonylcarbamoyladenosine biosynthesis protein TsaE